MRRTLIYAALALLVFNSGCNHLRYFRIRRGQADYVAMQSAAAAAVRQVADSVVHIEPSPAQPGANDSRAEVLAIRRKAARLKPVAGVVLSAEGHVLMPGVVNPEDVERLIIWVGANEYQATVLKVDEQLRMTIIKFRPEGDAVPLSFEKTADLRSGSWCVCVRQSGEDNEFAPFVTSGFCRGTQAARYRIFDVNDAFKKESLAPVMTMKGVLAGFAVNGNVIAASDLRTDLLDFFNEAAGVIAPEEAARRKGWLGVITQPVNKNYARAHGLPRAALWVTHAVNNSPAFKAGIRSGDLITALNGEPLRLSGARAQSYFLQLLRPRVGRDFEITIRRDTEVITCKGVFAKKPEDEKFRARDIGIEVKTITEPDYFSHKLLTLEGVLVTDVEPGSAAATSSTFRSGLLRENDVILEMDGQPTPTLDDFKRVIDDVRKRELKVLLIYFQRGSYGGYAGLNLRIGDGAGGGEM
jgi:serine protease Do